MLRAYKLAAVLLLGVIEVACSDSPTSVTPTLIVVDGLTASSEDLDVTLDRFNLSWAPSDETPSPQQGNVFVTVLFKVVNRGEAPRFLSVNDFRLRTLSDELHTGPVWAALNYGRTPRLTDTTLLPGEIIAGWLTYSVPRELLAEEVLWAPSAEVVFAIEVPWFVGGRVEEALIFGTVLDMTGQPLPNVSLTISPVETIPGIPGSEATVGDCTGTVYRTTEAETDAGGSYQITVTSVNATELCIDVLPTSNPDARVSGIVRPGRPTEIQEAPQLRLDLVLAGK